ncbi:NAD(P)/FAD-dependent oxidoreductase [Shumkonia mesophila]|uniref:NAD(P)/FAD-dependent oxidoreductase n=1 Tax=Shumkonia mesophila TaxID=2838854 RepID=UPI002934D1B7|nr:FAD-dependent oxidoreductase [Shumkonia mesophila]
MRYVLIGGGPAGVTAAETLRRVEPTADITLIGGEAGPPYCRMAIPYFLAGDIAEEGTHFRHAGDHYARLGIRYLNDRVEAISAADGRIRLAGGADLAYDRLLLATGSRPAMLPVAGLDTPGVHSCWTLDDARRIAARATAGAEVVLIGAGFVACIIMQALAQRGMKLTVVAGSSGRMVRSMMDETAGDLIMRWCRERGVSVLTGQRVAAIEAGPTVLLADGQALKADLVVVASGVRPNSEFAAAAGVAVEEGIAVDEYLRTSVEGIFAAGDVAQGPDFSTRTRSVHAIQPTATEHGRVAALNMAGHTVAYRGSLGMNVLDTLGLISSSFGHWQGVAGGEAAVHLDAARFRYMDLKFDGDRLIGVNSVGRTENLGALRGLIQKRTRLGAWKDRLMANPYRFMEALVAATA